MYQMSMAHQRGMTLIEVILATTVAAFMLYLLIGMQSRASDELRAKANADSLKTFSQMAVQYLSANRGGIASAMTDCAAPCTQNNTDAANFCVIGANPTTGLGGTTTFVRTAATAASAGRHTCAVDANWLKWKKLLPADYKETNPYGQTWVAIYSLVYADYDNNAGTVYTTKGDVEILIVGTGGNESNPAELGLTAELLGGIGGFVPKNNIGSCTTTQACGSGGAWKADLSKF